MTYGLSKCKNKPCGKPFTRKAWNHEYCSISCQRIVGIQAYQDGVKKRNSRGMHFSKLSGSASLRRVYNLLINGPRTTKQIERLANVSNPATWVSMLRKNGIDALDAEHVRTNADGTKVYRYALANSQGVKG